MINLGSIPAGATIPFPFDSYDAAGGSVTISGLAVTDIEIYKNGIATTRASDNGYALLDTDGIDFASTTGLHGFSVDLSNNSDSGFFAAGSFYWVNVNAITVDSQTVRFTYFFRIIVAEGTAGTPVVDVGRISNDATAADNAESFFDGTGYAGTNNVIPLVTLTSTLTTYTGNTVQTGDSFARIGAAGASLTDLGGMSATMKTQINTEVLDVLNVDTFAEVGQESPAATTTIRKMIAYLYKFLRNKKTQTSTTTKIFADDGTTVDQKSTVSDDGSTFTSGEFTTGP